MSGCASRGFASKRFFTALAVTLMAGARLAHAQAPHDESTEPFRLVWSSSAGCRDEHAFLAELAGRTTRLRQARADEHAITLIVETFRSDDGVRGQLTVRKPDGELTLREVPGVSCQEVEAAMALIAALMVDPLAGQPSRKRPAPTPQTDPETRRESSAWSFRAEQRLTLRDAIAPRLTWGQALGVMLTHESSALKPSVRLSAERAEATASAPHGSAELTWAAARLAICPIGVQPDRAWDLRTCATAELGRLRGSGFATEERASKTIVWSSAGIELEARYEVMERLWAGLEGGLNFPFTRERFYVDPSETLHRVPPWGLGLGVGLGLRFF